MHRSTTRIPLLPFMGLGLISLLVVAAEIAGQETPAASAPATQPTTASAPAPRAIPATAPAQQVPATPVREAPAPLLPPEWVDTLRWRCIGPANMGGRIADIAVYEADPCIWWVATASGGLLKTENNGITFEHQFDHENTVSIGDVAVAQSDPNIVWVGTGEANPRNSVSWGDGVYKSTDGGQTWQHMGLRDSFQIGRIAIHPTDPNIVYVGALGRLWGPNQQRGLYKTTDAGQTWKQVLYVDQKTGVVDVQMHPEDPQTLIAATYERQRDEYDSNDPARKWGPGSGLYKTTDGGQTWKKLTPGLPSCDLGRIGIDYYRQDPNIVYVVLESKRIGQEPKNAAHMGIRGEDADVGARLTEITTGGPADEAGLKVGDIAIAIDGQTVHSYRDLISAIRQRVAGDTVEIEVSRERKSVLTELTLKKRPQQPGGEQQRVPFSSGLGGQRENAQQQQGPQGHEYGGVYQSTDGGESWTRINSVNPRPMYFSQIRVDPSDNDHLWVLGIALYRSKDGGETFTDDGASAVHVDHHAMWIDPEDGRHIILGNDGGVYVTYDRGENWDHLSHMAIGQFYHVTVDPRRNYRVYGGLQDNGSWGGPSRGRDGNGPVNNDWFMLGWGDGFICRVDHEDPDQVYFASQNGAMGRYNLRTGERGFIQPRRERGTRYRFNWKTPYILSHHNSRILYTAANVVFRSLNRGEKLRRISPELTRTDKGSATALAESPLDPDALYVGTDDGLLWVTRDGGHEWSKLVDFPQKKPSPIRRVADWGRSAWQALGSLGGESSDRPAARAAAPPRAAEGRTPATRPSPGARGARLVERLKRLDANGDGRIQKDEAPERMRRLFERFDANGDDVLDAEELKALSERPPGPPPRGGRRGDPDAEPPPGNGNGGSADAEPPAAPDAPAASQPVPVSQPATRPVGPEGSGRKGVSPSTQEDPVSGKWEAHAINTEMPPGQGDFSLLLRLAPDGVVSGVVSSMMGDSDISDGHFSADAGKLTCAVETGQMILDVSATIRGAQMVGSVDVGGGMFVFEFEASRTQAGQLLADAELTGPPQAEAEEHDWTPLTELLPGPRWVSWIEASRYRAGRVYVTLDGHRSDDDEPYVLLSEDYGQGWRSLRANLPANVGSTRVIREDVENPDILYLGTEFGAWISVDRGASWTKLNSNLPTVAVHEFALHPTAGEIVAATHGRSLWLLDVTPLRQITKRVLDAPAYLYQPNSAIHWRPEPQRGGDGARQFHGENPAGGAQVYYSLKEPARQISLKITDPAGETIRELEADGKPGLHHVTWDLRRTPEESQRGRRGPRRGRLVPSGKYVVELTVDRQTLRQDLTVETDPDFPDYRAWEQEPLEQQSPTTTSRSSVLRTR